MKWGENKHQCREWVGKVRGCSEVVRARDPPLGRPKPGPGTVAARLIELPVGMPDPRREPPPMARTRRPSISTSTPRASLPPAPAAARSPGVAALAAAASGRTRNSGPSDPGNDGPSGICTRSARWPLPPLLLAGPESGLPDAAAAVLRLGGCAAYPPRGLGGHRLGSWGERGSFQVPEGAEGEGWLGLGAMSGWVRTMWRVRREGVGGSGLGLVGEDVAEAWSAAKMVCLLLGSGTCSGTGRGLEKVKFVQDKSCCILCCAICP